MPKAPTIQLQTTEKRPPPLRASWVFGSTLLAAGLCTIFLLWQKKLLVEKTMLDLEGEVRSEVHLATQSLTSEIDHLQRSLRTWTKSYSDLNFRNPEEAKTLASAFDDIKANGALLAILRGEDRGAITPFFIPERGQPEDEPSRLEYTRNILNLHKDTVELFLSTPRARISQPLDINNNIFFLLKYELPGKHEPSQYLMFLMSFRELIDKHIALRSITDRSRLFVLGSSGFLLYHWQPLKIGAGKREVLSKDGDEQFAAALSRAWEKEAFTTRFTIGEEPYICAFESSDYGDQFWNIGIALDPDSSVQPVIGAIHYGLRGLWLVSILVLVGSLYIVSAQNYTRLLLESDQRKLLRSEKRYRSFIDLANDSIVVASMEGNLKTLEANRKFCGLLGYLSEQEVLGRPLAEFCSRDDLGKLDEIMRYFSSGGTFAHFESNLVRKDGQNVPVDVSASHITVEDEKLVLIMIRDVSDVKIINDYLNSILESIRDGFCVVDPQLNVMYWNTGAEKILKIPRDTVLGDDLRSVFSSVPKARMEQLLDATVKKGSYVFTSYAVFPNGVLGWFSFRSYLMPEGSVAIFFEDVSEQMRMEREIAKQNQELQAKNIELKRVNQLKSEFLSNMTHELRTPLNSIIGYSELLLSKQDGAAEEMRRIRMNGVSLLNMINGILDLSKIEAGHMDLHLEFVDLEELLEDVIIMTEPLAYGKEIKLTADIPRDFPKPHTDRVKLRQILINLLSNAIKFTHKGNISIQAILKDADNLEITVEDSGIGIAEKDLRIIFDEFRQVDGSTTRRYGGTGLGLAIAKNFVTMLGGSIRVKSKPNVGSRFTISVPMKTKKPEAKKIKDPIPPTETPAEN